MALGMLLAASPWGCSSQRAITIASPNDAGTDGETWVDSTTSTTTSTATSTALFSDNFSSGYGYRWAATGSDDGPVADATDNGNAIAVLDSSATSYARLCCNLDGTLFGNVDITASLRFRVDQTPSSSRSVRLDVRQAEQTQNIFYAVGATVSKDGVMTKVSIFKKVAQDPTNYTICSLAEAKLATPVPIGDWHALKLAVRGDTSVRLTAFFDDTEMASAVDDCRSDLTSTAGETVANGGCLADQTGLGIQVESGLKASVDDVLVTAL
jgi:hypothetical protein